MLLIPVHKVKIKDFISSLNLEMQVNVLQQYALSNKLKCYFNTQKTNEPILNITVSKKEPGVNISTNSRLVNISFEEFNDMLIAKGLDYFLFEINI